MLKAEKYIKTLRQRAKESHVYRDYQMTGLMVAGILGDKNHTSLYIKLAKEKNGEKLLQLAKDVADRKGVKNKGAYFMYCLANKEPKPTAVAPQKRMIRKRIAVKP